MATHQKVFSEREEQTDALDGVGGNPDKGKEVAEVSDRHLLSHVLVGVVEEHVPGGFGDQYEDW